MKQTITIFIILGAGILLLALIQSMSTSGVVEQASQVVDIADKPNARIEGGTRVVPATELRVTNQTSNISSSRVPDGRIYLSNSRDGTGRVDLGALRGSSGDYNFRAPTGIDPSDYKYVLIWCRAFSSLVGIAEIR